MRGRRMDRRKRYKASPAVPELSRGLLILIKETRRKRAHLRNSFVDRTAAMAQHDSLEVPIPDRSAAGRALAGMLSAYAGRPDVVVLALPRGGVPVAYEIAMRLG